jgi:DNA modification methylase
MTVRILTGDTRDVLKTLPSESVNCCVTSPPYFGLRSYLPDGHDDKHLEIGLEPSPDEYVAALVAVFREVKRVLRNDGTLWLNIGDSYNAHPGQRKTTDKVGPKQETNGGNNTIGSRYVTGCKPKDLIGIPWMLAFALRADGWYLRQDIIWSKPNPMPESVRTAARSRTNIMFLLSKSSNYHYDAAAVAEVSVTNDLRRPYGSHGANVLDPRGKQGEGKIRAGKALTSPRNDGNAWNECGGRRFTPNSEFRNRRSVWTIATEPYSEAHFATFPPALIEPCILAGCPKGGAVLDPFGGAGTTGLVADRLGRDAILLEINPEYAAMARRRIADDAGMFAEVA